MALATLGPVGHLRPAPGSWGSAAALVIAAGLASLSGWLLEAALVAVCIAGIPAADVYERVTGHKDASPVVIDEVAGQWIALLVVPIEWQWVGLLAWPSCSRCIPNFFRPPKTIQAAC